MARNGKSNSNLKKVTPVLRFSRRLYRKKHNHQGARMRSFRTPGGWCVSYRKFRVCSCWNSAPLFRVFRAHIPRCSAETEIPHLADLDARITRGTAGYIARTARSPSFSLLDISIRCVAGIIYRHIAPKFVENVWLRNQGRSVFIDFNYFILQRSKC